jgi:hypothetical protein
VLEDGSVGWEVQGEEILQGESGKKADVEK